MKQNYMLSIGLLIASHIAFSMEEENPEQLVTWFKKEEGYAQSNVKKWPEPMFRVGLAQYDNLISKSIPLSTETPDPYKEARDIQARARTEMINIAKNLEREGNYYDAQRLYQAVAPDLYKDNIDRLELLIKEQKEKLVEWFQNRKKMAEDFESKGTPMDIYTALSYYGELLDKFVPGYPGVNEAKDVARQKIINVAKNLEQEGHYSSALDIYKFAPNSFGINITRLEKLEEQEEKKQKQEEETEKAVKIAEQIIKHADTAKKELDLNKKLELYSQILKLQLSCPPKASKTCRTAIFIQNATKDIIEQEQLKKTLLQLTEKLRSLADYLTHAPL